MLNDRTRACVARDIGERIGRVGHHEKDRVGLRPHDPRHDVAIDLGIPVEQFEAPLRIVAISGTAGFFVHARSDQHNTRAREGIIIAVDNIDLGTKRGAVAHVRRDRLGGLAGTIDQDDLARAAAGDGGHCAGAADIAGSDNSDLHRLIRCFRPSCRRRKGLGPAVSIKPALPSLHHFYSIVLASS